MQPRYKQQPLHIQFIDLFLIELTNWRWSWRFQLVIGTLAPLLSIVALGFFARSAGEETLTFILTGNMIMALSFGIQNKLQNHLCYLRITGAFEYFATLPIQRSLFVLAMVLAFLLLALPSLLVTVLLGAFVLGIQLAPSLWLLLIVPLCAVPFAGIGAIIAVYARSPEDADAMSLVVTIVMLILGPVMVPPDQLPEVMLYPGYLSPATYAASALRQALLGPVTNQIWLDITALVVFSSVIFWLVGRKLDWREK